MVDVGGKAATVREAVAEATITLSPEAFQAVMSGEAKKGDVLAAARIAGIMAAKKTADLIPLCHPIALTKAAIAFEPDAERNAIIIIATASTTGPTGVEMEALTAASIAALTIYDMIKAVDRSAVIEAIRLRSKSGGKSGQWRAPEAKAPVRPARKVSAPSPLIGAIGAPKRKANAETEREAFRQFMTGNRLRASAWAKQAGIPAALIYSFLTGRSQSIPAEAAEKLANIARVRPEDMFR
jgi:cyclic pyranopterin phosphate synthase